MIVFADLVPGNVLAWLAVGLFTCLLAGFVMKGRADGVFADVVLGLLGAGVGSLLLGLFVSGTTGFWDSILVAFLGACALIAVVQIVTPSPTTL